MEILDAEWEDLPTVERSTVKGKGVKLAKVSKPKRKPKASSTPVGRIDILASNALQLGYQKLTGQPASGNISEAITKATQMILGKTKAKGLEWDFLQSLMGG